MTTTPAMPELHRDQIIDLISPLSKNSADHDIDFAYRVIDALATLQAQPAAKCDGNHGGPRCADPECWNDDPPAQPASAVVSDEQIRATWKAWPRQAITSADRAVEFSRAILALRPQAETRPDSYEDILQALLDINIAAVMLPEFDVRHEGGLKEATKNIVEAINAASLRPQAVPMTLDQVERVAMYWAPEYRVAIKAGIAAAEAHHGITAPAGGEGKA